MGRRILAAEEQRLSVAIRELRRGAAMQAFRDRIYGEDGLDPGQHDALEVVVALGEARMGDLAAALRVDASTATRTVARLEALGLVQRSRGGDDRRAVVVVPTPAGLDRHERLRERARAALADVYSVFDRAEVATLAELLERLVASLDRVANLPPGPRSQ